VAALQVAAEGAFGRERSNAARAFKGQFCE